VPELPEVETTLRGIQPYLLHQPIEELVIRNGSLRWPISPTLPRILRGQSINSLNRRGKYILAGLDRGTLIMHLGMSGSLRMAEGASASRKHDHYDLVLKEDSRCLRFHDPRRFGCLLWTESAAEDHPLLANLGPEPLAEEFDGECLFKRSRGRSQAVKTFIMDGRVVVGVGNIYASESLFVAGIAPERSAGDITVSEYQRLAEAIRAVLSASIRQGGTTLRDFVNESGAPGYFRQQLNVYDRAGEPCRRCGSPIQSARFGQRSTFWCAECQQ
jgi:formamidopyrimidine-DNA glycosylase